MSNNPVGWFEIYVQDMERAKRFYEEVFDTKLERLEGSGTDLDMWAFPGKAENYGTPGALVRMPGFPSGGNSVLVYFSCPDCGATARKAAQAGGRIEKDKFAIGAYGHVAMVVDPEGNMIGLHSME